MTAQVKSSKPTPPTLLAILIGARRAGDRILETAVRRELREQHGIAVNFVGGKRPAGGTCKPHVLSFDGITRMAAGVRR